MDGSIWEHTMDGSIVLVDKNFPADRNGQRLQSAKLQKSHFKSALKIPEAQGSEVLEEEECLNFWSEDENEDPSDQKQDEGKDEISRAPLSPKQVVVQGAQGVQPTVEEPLLKLEKTQPPYHQIFKLNQCFDNFSPHQKMMMCGACVCGIGALVVRWTRNSD